MNVQIGQVWEDTDRRRSGRTFKVTNIDIDGTVTCENLTGVNGAEPSKPISFINKKRFISKYYKLKNKVMNTATTLGDGEVALVSNTFHQIPIVRRQPRPILLEEAKNIWPGDWREVGQFLILSSENEDFEVTVRPMDRFNGLFNVRIRLYTFCIWDHNFRSSIKDALEKTQDYFLVLSSELNNFISNRKN